MGDFEKRKYLVKGLADGQQTQMWAVPYGPPYEGIEVWAFSPVEAVALVARGELSRPPVEPRTPREALLAIRAECRGIHTETDPFELALACERHIQDGLAPSAPDTYEWTDNLAGRLAECVHLLTRVKENAEAADQRREGAADEFFAEKYPMLAVEIDSALALPPDIEAAIELRRPR